MSFLDVFRGRPIDQMPTTDYKAVTLTDLEHNYDILDVNTRDGFVIVADKQATRQLAEPVGSVPKGEISGSGETRYRSATPTDYNPNLAGRTGVDQYLEMKNDAAVRTSLRLVKTPILSARWFMEPASQDQADIDKANFIWKNLTQWMSMSFPQFLVETLLCLDYGVYAFEKVFTEREVDGERRIIWQKFAPRPPWEIQEFEYDDEGGPANILIETETGSVPLPIEKGLIFTFDKEAGNLWGRSVLRSAYKHWFYKETMYKIDAIQKERHGIGIPVVKLPHGWQADTEKGRNDRAAAEAIGRNLRTNEEAHVILPPGWEVMFIKLEGQHVDALASAEHHKQLIYENVLANFINPDTSDDLEGIFTRSVRFAAEIIRDVVNHYAIPQLMLYNWPEEEMPNGYPQLKVRRLGDERDWRVLSFAIRNLVGAGVVRPDDKLEQWARDEMDMPIADVDTARQIVTEVGMEAEDDPDAQPPDSRGNEGPEVRNPQGSRQSNAGGMRQAQTPGSSRGDSSGTSGTRGGS